MPLRMQIMADLAASISSNLKCGQSVSFFKRSVSVFINILFIFYGLFNDTLTELG
jgi:hypothetical protein